MRISDWSSDVCSSDLQSEARLRSAIAGGWPAHPGGSAEAERVAKGGPGRRRLDEGCRPKRRAPEVVRSQIGRASWSGKRVSVSVDLGGRRINYKKHRHTTSTNRP